MTFQVVAAFLIRLTGRTQSVAPLTPHIVYRWERDASGNYHETRTVTP